MCFHCCRSHPARLLCFHVRVEMEESHEILLNSLKIFGIDIPPEISSVPEINPTTLFSICTQSLRLLPLPAGDETPSFPSSLPDSMSDRVRICTDVASALRNLGFVGDTSFHKFLYPSEEDLYKLVRFLVGRLSETSEATEIASTKDVHPNAQESDDIHETSSEVCSETTGHPGELEFSGNGDMVSVGKSNTKAGNSEKIDQTASLCPSVGMLHISKESLGDDDSREPTETLVDLRQIDVQSEDVQGDSEDVLKFIQESTSSQVLASQEFDGQDCVEFLQSNKEVKAGKLNLQQLKDQWDNSRRPLEEDKVLSLYVNNSDAQGKFQKLKYIEQETEAVLTEIRNREEECVKLTAELENQPKVASRRSYVERITEITKNSRKQNADIESILKETRELQLESNSIEERLHRSYAVVDEMVFREAKKEIVSRQAYRLLSSIHDSFKEIREKVLETDRTRREVADIEAMLTTIATRSLDMEKLQADLDAIRRENESLERKLHGPL